VLKLVAPILLLPNSLSLRLLGVFNVLSAGSDLLLKPKTQQSLNLAGCRFKHRMFRAGWLRRPALTATVTEPFLARSYCRQCTPENSTQGPRLAGGCDAMSQKSFCFSHLHDPSSQSAIQQHGRECRLVERNRTLAYLIVI
jgi:hypothetical protein